MHLKTSVKGIFNRGLCVISLLPHFGTFWHFLATLGDDKNPNSKNRDYFGQPSPKIVWKSFWKGLQFFTVISPEVKLTEIGGSFAMTKIVQNSVWLKSSENRFGRVSKFSKKIDQKWKWQRLAVLLVGFEYQKSSRFGLCQVPTKIAGIFRMSEMIRGFIWRSFG